MSVPTSFETPDPPEPGARPLSLFSPEYRGLVVGVVGVVVAVAFEAIAVVTAMPVAARELGGLREYGLAFSVFLTGSLLGMAVAGEVADRRGPVRPFVAAAVVFALGLLLAGLAPTMEVLVLARGVQGLGGGLNIVALYVVVGRAFPSALRPRVFSAMASGWILPSLIGPPIAGLLADEVSWRWVFLAALPMLLGAVLLIRPHLRGLDAPVEHPGGGAPARRRTLAPALAAALGAGLLQYAGQLASRGGRDPVLLGLALGVPALVVLALSVPRLLPTGSLRLARGLPTAVILRGVISGAFFGAETFIPLMLVELRSLATTLAGASLTAAALTWSLGSWIQGRPGLRTPRRVLVTVGFLLVVLGVGLAAAATSPAVPVAAVAVGWAFAGLGMGLGMTSLSVLVLEASAPHEQGVNSSALQVSDALGSIVLIGAAGAVYAAMSDAAVASATPFLVIDVVMAAVLLAGAAVTHRLRDTR